MEKFNHTVEIYFWLHFAAGRILTSNELKIILHLHLIKDHQVYSNKNLDDEDLVAISSIFYIVC